MRSASCLLRTIQRPVKGVYLTASLMDQLSLSDGDSVELLFGDRKVTSSVYPIKGSSTQCHIPSELAEQLLIPYSGEIVRMTYENEKLRVAPLFGIMTTAIHRTMQKPFGGRTKMFEGFLRSAGPGAFYFVFVPQEIDWEQRTIKGYFLQKGPKGGHWTTKTVPFPNVVYNRLPNRVVEKLDAVERAKTEFYNEGIPMFNPDFFNKWEIYQLIHDHPSAASYMPETHFAPGPAIIRSMLNRYDFVYVKPSGGSLGLGIFKVSYHPREGYLIQYRNGNQNVLKRTHQFDTLMRFLSNVTRNKSGYIVQQGINLMKVDGNPVDFRVHLTKDRRGDWQVVGVGAKIAGRGSVTTHVRTGGTVTTPEYVLQRAFGSGARKHLEAIRSTSIQLAQAIEQMIPGLLGEVGFDIGVDANGNVWMFEANSKPGFSIFKHPSLKDSFKRSMRNIYEHSLYLADRQMKES